MAITAVQESDHAPDRGGSSRKSEIKPSEVSPAR